MSTSAPLLQSADPILNIGDEIEAKWTDEYWYNARIRQKTVKGYLVHYYEFGETELDIPLSHIKRKVVDGTQQIAVTAVTMTTTTSVVHDSHLGGEDPDSLREWLKELNLKKYYQSFKDQEFEYNMILNFNTEDIEEMLNNLGIKAGSKIKIKNDLIKRIELKKIHDTKRKALEKWLESISLQKYLSTFEKNGYTDLEKIQSFDQSQIEKMIGALGMKAGSSIKLKNGLANTASCSIMPNQTIDQPDELLEWLKTLKLEKYHKVFIDNEYDFNAILGYKPVEIDDMLNVIGIKAGSKIKIKNDLIERIGSTEEKEIDEVGRWLQSIELGKYAKQFKDNEYQCLDVIKSFNKDQIEEMIQTTGIKAGSAIKLKNALLELEDEEQPYEPLNDDNDDNERQPSQSWILNNEAMDSNWSPEKNNMAHLDKTNVFARSDMTCSVRDTCARIKQNQDGICDQLPEEFYVKSSRYKTYFKIKIRRVQV